MITARTTAKITKEASTTPGLSESDIQTQEELRELKEIRELEKTIIALKPSNIARRAWMSWRSLGDRLFLKKD